MMVVAILGGIVCLGLAWKLHHACEPARYFLLFWGLQVVLLVSLLLGTFAFNGKGLTYIAVVGLVFSGGSMLGRYWASKGQEKTAEGAFRSRLAFWMLVVGFVLSMVHLVEGLWLNGYSLGDLMDGQALLRLNDAASDRRYLTPLPVSMLSRVTLVFLYLTPLYAGYVTPLGPDKRRWWSLLTLLPSLLMAVTLSVKSTFITSVALWGVGWMVSDFAHRTNLLKIGWKTVLRGTVAVLLLLGVLFVSMVLRTGAFDRNSIQETKQKMVVYACGHLPAFDGWFEQRVGQLEPSWGVKTFYGLSNPLGLAKREQGVFKDYVVLGKPSDKPVPHLMDTNVYTLFRFLLEDFGLVGSAVFMLLIGILSGFAWMRVKRWSGQAFFQVVLMAVLFTIAWSFVGSVWAYTSYVVTFGLMWVAVKGSFAR